MMTTTQTPLNLDLLCASQAQSMTKAVIQAFKEAQKDKPAEKTENLITRTLGVLQGQGIYAAFLLLASRKAKEETVLSKSLVALIKEAIKQDLGDDPLTSLIAKGSILENLPTLLLVKRVMEQALVYARYHAKAAGEQVKEEQPKAGAANA